ncbi:hypothetical protein AB432_016345 [Brevibacillus brevis]|uniref:Uncharacterized protein n=1 Tax=Brevibacillus brevis TaxID=1393 RepID=A0A2Z4MJG6_BREBE|nr:hypothetical protein AB432_016345 [Brevibacillus brevis]
MILLARRSAELIIITLKIGEVRETVKTFKAKENPTKYKPQITLAKRRIEAFEISVSLIEREINDLDKKR